MIESLKLIRLNIYLFYLLYLLIKGIIFMDISIAESQEIDISENFILSR